MRPFSTRIVLLFVCALALAESVSAQGSAPPAPVFAKTRFEKNLTEADTILNVKQIGRYSIQAQSGLPNSIELVDRMAGTIASADGPKGLSRIDTFLETGEYKIRIRKRAEDQLVIQALPYTTINAGPGGTFDLPSLVDGQNWSSTLTDLQMAAWWIRVDQGDKDFNLEAMGRSLAGMMIMKDGLWVDASESLKRNFDLSSGRPLNYFERNQLPEPGMYLLVCYGGPRNTWGDQSGAEPFMIRKGSPYLGTMGSVSVKIGEFGIESLLLSGSARQVQAEVPKAGPYRFSTSSYEPGRSRLDSSQLQTVDVKSNSLRRTIQGAGGNRQWFVIQGPPGETVKVRFYPSSGPGNQAELRYGETGSWISTVLGSLESDDQGPFSGLGLSTITNANRTQSQTNITRTKALSLSNNDSIHLKINNFGSTSYIVNVADAGNYSVFEKDQSVNAAYSFRPLDDMVKNAPGQPVKVVGGQSVSLLAKIYFVAVDAAKQGVLEFAIGKTNAAQAFAAPLESAEPGFSFVSSLANNLETQRYLVTARGQAAFGAISRKLPLDITEPISVTLAPGEKIDIPLLTKTDLQFYSTESLTGATLDGAAAVNGKLMQSGVHNLSLTNTGKTTQSHVLYTRAQNDTQSFTGPLKVDAAALYPSFRLGKDNWQDFDRDQTSYYSLIVDKPGPYRIETTGRLSMAVEIRSPLRPKLFSGQANTNGGNAVVSAYLREGSYLVKVSTMGRSKGRAGLSLIQPPVLSGDGIVPDSISRADVDAQALLATNVRIEKAGSYLFETLGLGRSFPFRFEDSEGWPIGQPIQNGQLESVLAAGSYRFISYPDDVLTRRILRVVQIIDSTPPKDPVSLILNGTINKVWIERPGRSEDVLGLELPAPIEAGFTLTEGMEYRITDQNGELITAGKGGKTESLRLPAGKNTFYLKSIEVDNEKTYSISLFTNYLTVSTPESINTIASDVPVGVGTRGFYEIWSYGKTEIEAALYDENGQTVVAKSERIPGDWNFRIVALLEPGRYRLRTSDPGASQAIVVNPAKDEVSSAQEAPAENDADYEGSAEYEDSSEGDDSGYSEDSVDYQDEEVYEDVDEDGGSDTRVVATNGAATQGAVNIGMLKRDERNLPDAKPGFDIPVQLDSAIARFKFQTSEAAVYRFGLDKDISSFIAVLKDGKIIANGAAPFYLPMSAGAYEIQFRLNSPSSTTVSLRGAKVSAREASIAAANSVSGGEFSLSDDDVIAVGNSDGLSFAVQGGERFLYSPGFDKAFELSTPGDLLNTMSGKGWIMKVRDGSQDRLRVIQTRLDVGKVISFDSSAVKHVVPVTVDNGSIALVQASGTKSLAALSLGAKSKWFSTPDGDRSSYLGLAAGDALLSIWNPRPYEGTQRFSLRMTRFPLSAGPVLAQAKANEGSIGPRQAFSMVLPSRAQTIDIKLQKGALAFVLPAQNLGLVNALKESASGSLSANGGNLVIVNTSAGELRYEIRTGAAAPQALLTETRSSEIAAGGTEPYSLNVQAAAGKTVWIYGADASLFSDDDGLMYDSRPARVGNEAWSVLPSATGRIEVKPRPGPVKLWIASQDNVLKSLWGGDVPSFGTKIDAGDVPLGQKAEAWSFSLGTDSVVRVQADGPGLLALVDKDGNFVAESMDANSPSLMKALSRGDYRILTRPVESQTRSGWLHFDIPDLKQIDEEGPGEPALVSDTDIKLYKFAVQEDGRVGMGVSGEEESLLLTVYDSAFNAAGSGTLLIRELKAGTYYMVVRSLSGTQRFRPMVYGIHGNRVDIPDDIRRSYMPEQ